LHYDATEEFASRLNDPTKWVTRPGVPIFKPHRRVDPNTGREIVVDVPKLYRIAQNLQRMERQGGVPIRMTLGHTEPGKPETEQPPVAGYYRNARVQPFGPKGEPAVVVDEWLDPTYKGHRKNFPYRSSEYYDDTEQITGVALLTRDPYLDLGVVAYEGATLPVKGPVLYSAAGQPRTAYQYLLGDAPMWPYGYDANGQPLPAPQAPTVPPIHPVQAAPVYPTAYQAPHVQTGYGLPAAPPQVPPQQQAPRGPAPVGYAAPQPAPLLVGRPVNYSDLSPAVNAFLNGGPVPSPNDPTLNNFDPRRHVGPLMYQPSPSGAPFSGGYTQSPAAMSHSNEWQFRNGGQGQRYADQIPGQTPVQELMGPGTPPHQGMNAPEEDDEAGLNALHHHMSQAVEHLSRYMQAGRKPQAYAPTPSAAPPSPGFPGGQGTADSPYARNAGRYEGERIPVAYQLELDKLQAKVRSMEESQKVVMYERDQADTAACESEIRRLAGLGYAVDANDATKLKRTPLEHRPGFINEIMTKYSRVGTEALPPIMGDPSPMHDVGPPQNGGRATREQMMAALRATPADAPPDMYAQALQSVQYGGPQAQYGMNGEVQGPGNPFGDPYGT